MMDSKLILRKVGSRKMLTVDELVLAFRMMESQAEYWVASKILAERNGEDSSTSSIFHDYPQLREEMKMWDYLPEDQKSVWFDEQGQLLSDQKQDWCANAVPRALTFADMSTNPGREGLAINALLAQGVLTQLYKVDCLTFAEHTQYMHELHDKTKDGGRQQKIMAKMGWFSPVLYTASKAHPMVVPKTLYSPARACLSFNHSHSDVQDVLLACQKLPADRAFSETDLPLIHQTLSQLDK